MPITNQISRRDFLNGVAVSVVAGSTLSPLQLLAKSSGLPAGYYPPALTGMRGSHDGSYESIHAVAWGGQKFPTPANLTDDIYDCVIVGGGISGLSAAKFFRDRSNGEKQILVLDNHDDFGGHAKRNEFNVDGKKLISWGGSQTMESPSLYSDTAKALLKDLGIEVDRFYDFYDQEFYEKRNLGVGLYFDKATFGEKALTKNPFWPLFQEPMEEDVLRQALAEMPISEASRNAFFELYTNPKNYFDGMSKSEKETLARNTSYNDFLKNYAGATDELVAVIQDSFQAMTSVGWDAVHVYCAAEYGMPGTWLLDLHEEDRYGDPYIHHFPDGNAGIARALVRDLIPGALPGETMEELAIGSVNYQTLDSPASPIRIRLNSAVVDVAHTDDKEFVDVSYVQGGEVYRTRARHVIMACYNGVIPHICSDVPEAQGEAMRYGVKSPFVIGNIALRNWRAFDAAGYESFYTPGNHFFKYGSLDFPVSMGDYKFSKNPDEPIVFNGWYSPTEPGLPMKEQLRVARRKMLAMSFEEFEADIVAHFNGMLGDYGFDAERDIAAITLNRWSHGYAWEYGVAVGENAAYNYDNGPHIEGRAQIGRISIANSDSEASAYANAAIDAAHRAVNEQLR